MNNNKYKIVVLSDLKGSAAVTLKSAVSLAEMVGGVVELFHVKKPTDVVKRDNQLSAIRGINEKQLATEKNIEKMINPISKEFGVDIKYKCSFGNVKTEISNYIKESRPDVIVLGKRKPKLLKLMGDSISEFVLNTFDGIVMMTSDTNALKLDSELSLAVLNGAEQTCNIVFAEDLMSHSQKPLKSFKIMKNSSASSTVQTSTTNKKIVEYIFDEGDNAISNLSKYLSISKVNLLFVDRSNNSTPNLMESDIQNVMDDLNVSLMIGKRSTLDNFVTK